MPKWLIVVAAVTIVLQIGAGEYASRKRPDSMAWFLVGWGLTPAVVLVLLVAAIILRHFQ